MSAAKTGGLSAAAVALALGSFAVGQKVAAPVASPPRLVSLVLEPVPTMIISVPNTSERLRLRLACGEKRTLNSRPTKQGEALCVAAAAFAAAASKEVVLLVPEPKLSQGEK